MADGPKKGYKPPWDYSFTAADADPRPACIYCGNAEAPILLGKQRSDVGVCEGCISHARWLWRLLPGDSPPVGESARPTRVKVVISKLMKLSDGKTADPSSVYSYEFGLCAQADGTLDLPTADLLGSETETEAACRACSALLVSTWSRFVEPLYVAYTPRGRLVRVYLVTAYADASIAELPRLSWRQWPLDKHVGDSVRGFYAGFRDVWELRLWKHRGREPRAACVTTHVRESAARYIKLQQQLRSGIVGQDLDTSMAAYWRQSMSDDEKLVDRLLREQEEAIAARSVERRAEKSEESSTSADRPVAASAGPPAEIAVSPQRSDVYPPSPGPDYHDDADDTVGGEDSDDVDFE